MGAQREQEPTQQLTPLVAVLALALAVAVAAAFGGAIDHEFVSFDDPGYVHQNPHVTGGLSGENLVWAFTRVHMGNWHPLTWLSHMLDWELFADDAGGHHLVNVVLHGAAAVVLFLAWRALSGTLWTAALVAALFALHPLRVESVAWVSERKDVLSGLFFGLTLLAWARHARRPGRRRHLLVVAALVCGLMAKPMLVTLPLLLLLLEGWPLRRRQAGETGALPAPACRRRLVFELLPLLAAAAASVVLTLLAQQAGHAVRSLAARPLAERLLNLPVAYGGYLTKTLAPLDLAFLYPHPADVDPAGLPVRAAAWGALLLAISIACVLLARRGRPWLLLGWLWFCGLLVPVSGLVQVGTQGMADRYAYLPQIGLFVMAAHEARHLATKHPATKPVLVVVALALLAACGLASRRQVQVWSDGERLYRHALAVTTANPTAHILLGVELLRAGRLDEAEQQLLAAQVLAGDNAKLVHNLGTVALERGDLDEAERRFSQALRLKPDLSEALNDLAVVAVRRGDTKGALRHLRRALEIDPGDARAAANLQRLRQAQRR